MCGWIGILDGRGGVDEGQLRAMADTLHHRGPDDEGYWRSAEGQVGLGFRRLAILDLTPAGHQPMASAGGRYTMVFNGEIYNFADLRKELEGRGVTFRGHSDTEVLLAAFEAWGIRAVLPRLNGMFAMGIWDHREHRLTLARDRFGKKPLYLARCGSQWLMGSELKALRDHPAFQNAISKPVLAAFFRFGYVPGPHAIFEGVQKVPGGHLVELTPETTEARPEPFWEAGSLLRAGLDSPFPGTEAEGLEALEATLREAVGLRMVADVPLGAFLSGGIDSTVVVALMQAQSTRPVRTFTIGFHERAYNEADHAHAVARHLGTEHTELYLSPEDALATIPDLPRIFDEPFADPSQIPTFLVSRLARAHVTVALSGDGGDELFGGYHRYFNGRRIHRTLGPLPAALRGALGRGVQGLSPATWDRALAGLRWVMPARWRGLLTGDRLHKAAGLFKESTLEGMYRSLTALWPRPDLLLPGVPEAPSLLEHTFPELAGRDPVEKMMFLDLLTYLTDDILVKVDRASMACSLEARAPLLDPRVAELAWRLPLGWKLRGSEGKWLLRQLAYRHVPQALLDRPKMGFGVPVGAWLKGPLRPWAEALLEPAQLAAEGLDPRTVQRTWREHQAGTRDWQYRLWPLLMYLAWRRA